MPDLFGRMFDFNGDGTLDAFEQAAAFVFLSDLFEEEKTKLELSGLNPIELEFMNASERRVALQEAGLDPEKYDF